MDRNDYLPAPPAPPVRDTWGGGSPFVATALRIDTDLTVTHECCLDERALACPAGLVVGRRVHDVVARPISEAFMRSLGIMQETGARSHTEIGIEAEASGTIDLWEMIVFQFGDRGWTLVLRDFADIAQAHFREIAYVRRLQDFAQDMERVAEDERRAVAVELHDRVSQPLAAARMRLEEHEQRHEKLDVSTRAAHHREILRLIDDAIVESRAITSELAPAAYYELGLGPALTALGQDLERRNGLRCLIEYGLPPGVHLHDGVTAFIYRTARELLSNVERHSGAKEVWLTLSLSGGVCRLTVRDRGCGLDLGVVSGVDPRSDGGFGLFSIREHANRLGGDLTIQTHRGSGTCVVVDVPVGELPARR